VRHVFVGGQQIVGDGNALAFDYADASARLKLAQCRRDHAADRFARSEVLPILR